MEPVQKDCKITSFRLVSWIDKALAGNLNLCVKYKGHRAEILKGSYLLDQVDQKMEKEDIQWLFWRLMHKHKRIQVDDHIYLLTDENEELWISIKYRKSRPFLRGSYKLINVKLLSVCSSPR